MSDTRTPDTDTSGALIKELVVAAGNTVHSYALYRDDPEVLRKAVINLCDDSECQAVLINGGTGLTARDTSFEAVSVLLKRRIDGFGELFRMKSYHEIGPAAMLSRAVAGIIGDTVVFSMPGSTPAVRLAMESLILPELGHIAYLLGHR
jgi:molybdopterin adenylyltransferase